MRQRLPESTAALKPPKDGNCREPRLHFQCPNNVFGKYMYPLTFSSVCFCPSSSTVLFILRVGWTVHSEPSIHTKRHINTAKIAYLLDILPTLQNLSNSPASSTSSLSPSTNTSPSSHQTQTTPTSTPTASNTQCPPSPSQQAPDQPSPATSPTRPPAASAVSKRTTP